MEMKVDRTIQNLDQNTSLQTVIIEILASKAYKQPRSVCQFH